MKKIIVFSASNKIPAFKSLQSSKDIDLQIEKLPGTKTLKSQLEPWYYYYLDFSTIENTKFKKTISLFEKENLNNYGILDPKGEIADPASWFHKGATDYIGPTAIKAGINASRLNTMLDFYGIDLKSHDSPPEHESISWDDVQPGKESPFFFLILELDPLAEWKKRSEKLIPDTFMEKFINHCQLVLEEYEAQLWMRTNLGALFLVPFDHELAEDLIESMVRVLIDRIHISSDIFDSEIIMNYMITADVGITEYQKAGRTGKIISEDINYIFHLSQKYTKKGQLIITDELHKLLSKPLQGLFNNSKSFQSKDIYTMKAIKN